MLKKTLFFSFVILFIVSCNCFALSSSSDTIYEGIDVSQWQGYINYEDVKASGIDIVYIKASQGNNITDPYFKINYNNAKMNNLNIGFYHFLTARTDTEAIKEAEYFASVISGTIPDCKLAMDFEEFDSLSIEEINSISLAFLKRVQELTGKEVIVYSDAFNAKNTFNDDIAKQYQLWIADYGVSTPSDNVNWDSWIGFQYSDTGRINGINSLVDRDKFTNNIFLSSKDIVNTPSNTVNTLKEYTVRKGNTLSQIAAEFGTTVSEIAGLNGIRNPNLIFIGEVLKIDVTRPFNEIIKNSYETGHAVYRIKKGNTLTGIARMFGVSIQSIVKLNRIRNPNLIYTGEYLRINI